MNLGGIPVPVAAAQQAAPEPIVTVTVDPPRVVVGQQTTVRVTILAPNYMPAPPVLPDFQIRNAVTRGLGNVNQSATREGSRFFRRNPALMLSPVRRSP